MARQAMKARPVQPGRTRGLRGLLARFGFGGPRARPVREDIVAWAPLPDDVGRLEAKCVGCDPHVLIIQLDQGFDEEDRAAILARQLEESGWTFTAEGPRCPQCSSN